MSGDTTKGPIAWMAQNSVAANLLMVAFIVGGLITFRSITQEVFPDIQEDAVTVSVSYPGASPEEVERGIVLAVEEALTGLTGIEEITSTSGEGHASIYLRLIDGTDPMQAYQDIQSEVDRIRTLPDDAEEPSVSLNVRRRDVIELAIYGEASDAVLKQIAEQVREQLLQDDHITQVEIDGTRDLEVSVEISRGNLRRYGVTLEDIAQIIKQAAVEIPGGGVSTRRGEILVRMDERRDYGDEFARIPIVIKPDGTRVLLRDIATISDGLEERERFSIFNGKPAVMIEVFRVGKQTPVKVADTVLNKIEDIRLTLPDGIDIAVRRNLADIYEQRSGLLLRNGAIGLCLVIILLSVFLEIRLAFWVMMGIPISFLGSLLLMPVVGLSINMVTMFAYIVTLGIVVDDAIVVGENVYRHFQEGLPFRKAAVVGAGEVAMPVGFSILTNMVAFLPLYLMPGMMGRILGMLPIVVVTVFFISWIESLFILPAHLSHERKSKRQGGGAWLHEKQQRFSHGFRAWIHRRYAPFLSGCLEHRYLVFFSAIAMLLLTIGYMASGRMGFQLFPKVESDYSFVGVELPYGAPIEKTEAVAQKLMAAARRVAEDVEHPEYIEGMYARIGGGGTHQCDVRAYLVDPAVRKTIMSTAEFTKRWRKEVGNLKGVEAIRFMSDRGGPGSGQALTVELSHHNVTILEEAARELAAELEPFSQVSDIDDGFQYGKEQLSFRMKPEGLSLGLTALNVARQVRYAYEGVEVFQQLRGRNELTVRVWLPEDERSSEYSMQNLILRTPSGGEVPLLDVVHVERGRAYTSIRHRDGRRIMTVSADVTPPSQAGQVINALETGALKTLQQKYPGLTFSYEGRQAEERDSMGSLATTIPLVLLAIYALLAVPFRSYIQPMIVMMSIPFGVVGAVLGHLIMGYSMSIMGLIGIVALSGVVVNDSLVFVDFANRRRREGMAVRDALIDAGTTRFRPILLTTLTTFGGLAPMIFETSRQARFLIPMALSLGYGLLFATAITLLLVPSLYMIIEDVANAMGRKRTE